MGKIIYTHRYKSKKKKKPKKNNRLNSYAKRLEDNLPKSEAWFRPRYLESIPLIGDPLRDDSFNLPYGKYIPDVINIYYKYIIEIDGSIHDNPNIKLKDWFKDQYFLSRGFKVFRIKAYDETSLTYTTKEILKLRSSKI